MTFRIYRETVRREIVRRGIVRRKSRSLRDPRGHAAPPAAE